MRTWLAKQLFQVFFKSVSTGKGDEDQNVVQTLKDRQNLHQFLERKAELTVRGEKLVQQRFYEAVADLEVKHWEKRNSDVALHEIIQEFESQRLQLQQPNQWADQAHRDKKKLVWRIGNEEKTLLRKSTNRLARHRRIEWNWLRRNRPSKTSKN